MQDDLGRLLRVKWDKATNMFASFYRDLGEIRRAVGDEHLPEWCISHLKLGVSVIYRTSNLLTAIDAAIERDNLRRAREAEREANRLKREAKAKEAAERRQAKEAKRRERADQERQAIAHAKRPKRQNWRKKVISNRGIEEVRRAVEAGSIGLTKGAEIAGAPADMQSRLLDAALCKSRQKPSHERSQLSEAL